MLTRFLKVLKSCSVVKIQLKRSCFSHRPDNKIWTVTTKQGHLVTPLYCQQQVKRKFILFNEFFLISNCFKLHIFDHPLNEGPVTGKIKVSHWQTVLLHWSRNNWLPTTMHFCPIQYTSSLFPHIPVFYVFLYQNILSSEPLTSTFRHQNSFMCYST